MSTPLTELRLLNNVDLDTTYNHTFSKSLFGNLAGQISFFSAKTVFSFSNLTFQRKESTVKVKKSFDDIENLSYGMFKNGATGKWYFFFITDLMYVSENVTEIKIEIDVEQTYLFDAEIKNCFVEREHAPTDSIGDNTIEENLDIGTLKVRSKSQIEEFKNLTFVVASTKDTSNVDVQGQVVTGNYTGVSYYCAETSNIQTNADYVNAFINLLQAFGTADAIVSIFTIPVSFVDTDVNNKITNTISEVIPITVTKNISDLDGYTPRNKKLLTYPYNFLKISNNQGGEIVYRFERFSTSNMDFVATCDIAPSPTIYLRPLDYNGESVNEDEVLTLGNFPPCTWVNDFWQNWSAQNQISNSLKIGGSLLSLGAGIAGGGVLPIVGGALGVANTIGGFVEASIKPNRNNGSLTGSGSIASGVQTFSIYNYTLTSEIARVIDDYFTKFGYKTNRVKTPNVLTRTRHNYLRTQDTVIEGNIPRNYLKKMIDNREKGITFWHVDDIGNYSPTNSII